MHVLDKIRAEMAKSTSRILNREMLRYNDVQIILNSIKNGQSSARKIFFDVPIKNIVGIFLKEFYFGEPGDTWRDIVNKRLDGIGWDDKVITYFESDLLMEKFPPLDSANELRLACFGGVVFCLNGNHRLPAAIGWLVSKQGDDAVLKKASLLVWDTNSAVISKIIEWRSRGYPVDFCDINQHGSLRMAIRFQNEREIYRNFIVQDRNMVEVKAPLPDFNFWDGAIRSCKAWRPLPESFVEAWKNTSWLNGAAASPTIVD